MKPITSYDQLDKLGRVPLSPNFYMRDFLYSEIAAWHQLRNVPDFPDRAIAAGSQLCKHLLLPQLRPFALPNSFTAGER